MQAYSQNSDYDVLGAGDVNYDNGGIIYGSIKHLRGIK